MRFTTEQESFQAALQRVERAVAPRSPVPALSGIRLSAGAGQLSHA